MFIWRQISIAALFALKNLFCQSLCFLNPYSGNREFKVSKNLSQTDHDYGLGDRAGHPLITRLAIPGSSTLHVEVLGQDQCINVCEWLHKYTLSLHVQKTMHFFLWGNALNSYSPFCAYSIFVKCNKCVVWTLFLFLLHVYLVQTVHLPRNTLTLHVRLI